MLVFVQLLASHKPRRTHPLRGSHALPSPVSPARAAAAAAAVRLLITLALTHFGMRGGELVAALACQTTNDRGQRQLKRTLCVMTVGLPTLRV